MLQVLLGLKAPPAPDDAADALAMAVWVCHRERPGEQLNSGRLDRSAVAPLDSGQTRYEKAVRDALRREATTRRSAAG